MQTYSSLVKFAVASFVRRNLSNNENSGFIRVVTNDYEVVLMKKDSWQKYISQFELYGYGVLFISQFAY